VRVLLLLAAVLALSGCMDFEGDLAACQDAGRCVEPVDGGADGGK
jgi:hypothetical protein